MTRRLSLLLFASALAIGCSRSPVGFTVDIDTDAASAGEREPCHVTYQAESRGRHLRIVYEHPFFAALKAGTLSLGSPESPSYPCATAMTLSVGVENRTRRPIDISELWIATVSAAPAKQPIVSVSGNEEGAILFANRGSGHIRRPHVEYSVLGATNCDDAPKGAYQFALESRLNEFEDRATLDIRPHLSRPAPNSEQQVFQLGGTQFCIAGRLSYEDEAAKKRTLLFRTSVWDAERVRLRGGAELTVYRHEGVVLDAEQKAQRRHTPWRVTLAPGQVAEKRVIVSATRSSRFRLRFGVTMAGGRKFASDTWWLSIFVPRNSGNQEIVDTWLGPSTVQQQTSSPQATLGLLADASQDAASPGASDTTIPTPIPPPAPTSTSSKGRRFAHTKGQKFVRASTLQVYGGDPEWLLLAGAGYLPFGTPVEVLSVEAEWVHIRARGLTGDDNWVTAEGLSDSTAEIAFLRGLAHAPAVRIERCISSYSFDCGESTWLPKWFDGMGAMGTLRQGDCLEFAEDVVRLLHRPFRLDDFVIEAPQASKLYCKDAAGGVEIADVAETRW